jgi:hypothetical protein
MKRAAEGLLDLKNPKVRMGRPSIKSPVINLSNINNATVELKIF